MNDRSRHYLVTALLTSLCVGYTSAAPRVAPEDAPREIGVSTATIKAYLSDLDKQAERRQAISQNEAELRQRQQQLEARAQARYDACLVNVQKCEDACERSATSSTLAAGLQSLGGGDQMQSTMNMMAADADGKDCKSSCSINANCSALKP